MLEPPASATHAEAGGLVNVIAAPPNMWATFTKGDANPQGSEGVVRHPVVAFRTDVMPAHPIDDAVCAALVCGHGGELIPADQYVADGYTLHSVRWRPA